MRPIDHRRRGGAALLLLLLGCGESDERVSATTGLRIHGDASLTEELRIDGLTHDLVPITSLAVDDNGTIAVTQRQDHKVRFFGDAGMPAGEFGTKGRGPGEFEDMTRLGWIGDTLWVFDYSQGRVTLVGPQRQFVRDARVPRRARPRADAEGAPEFGGVMLLELLPDGSFHAMMTASAQGPVPEAFRDAAIFGVVGPDATVRGIMALMKGNDDSGVRTAAGVASLPFANNPSWAASPDGSAGALVRGITEGPDAGNIAVLMVTIGDTLYDRLHPFEAVPIPEDVGDSTLRAREQWLRNMNPALADAFRDAARAPPDYPPVVNTLFGRDRTLWIQEPLRDGMRQYLVIDTGGDAIGRLRIPRNATISVAQRDRIWVLERDEHDVQSIVRYRVDWSDS